MGFLGSLNDAYYINLFVCSVVCVMRNILKKNIWVAYHVLTFTSFPFVLVATHTEISTLDAILSETISFTLRKKNGMVPKRQTGRAEADLQTRLSLEKQKAG